ncbi:MAG: hypothetical protein KDE46_09100, partial [Caldilineaceae bacterium]|nr:hypothetical protein [Caldilineaceae bacterium]
QASVTAANESTPHNNVQSVMRKLRPPRLQFGRNAYQLYEGEGPFQAPVELDRANPFDDVVVAYTGSQSGILTIPRGQIRTSINIVVKDDPVAEADETWAFQLTNPRGAMLGANDAVQLTILDDDVGIFDYSEEEVIEEDVPPASTSPFFLPISFR